MNTHNKAIVLMAITALIWSSGGLAIKLAFAWNPMAITDIILSLKIRNTLFGFRSALAALIITLLFRKKLKLKFSLIQLVAAVAYAGLLITNVLATKLTTAANAKFCSLILPQYM